MRYLAALVCCSLLLGACADRARPVTRDSALLEPDEPPAAVAAPAPTSVPVQIGGSADMDACALAGLRSGTAPGAGVPVRAGPGAHFAVVDTVVVPQTFHSCDSTDEWVGIVYRKERDTFDSTGDCGGLGSPVADRIVYTGPCRSGWIPASAQEIVAG